MAIQTIGTDSVAAMGTNSSSYSSSTNFMDYMALGASSMGPVTEQSLLYSGNTGAATIASATANSLYAGASTLGGGSSGGGALSYLGTGGLGNYSSTPYLRSGSSQYVVDPTGLNGGSPDMSSLQNDMMNQMSSGLVFQVATNTMSNSFMMVSNTLSQKASTERSMIQNIKV